MIPQLYPEIEEYIKSYKLNGGSGTVRPQLKDIAAYIAGKIKVSKSVGIIFICTHNSRRSQFCQVWLSAALYTCGLSHSGIFSGGTEVTEFNQNAIEALRRAGFRISRSRALSNPMYTVKFAEKQSIVCFSKTYDDGSNPQTDFAAVMTCSEADANCPFIPGAEKRISLPYIDPGSSDGTPEKSDAYDTCCAEIAREMFAIASVAQKLLK